MQRCKIFEARNEIELENKYNEWAKTFDKVVYASVTHVNTFVKDGWYKMVVLYNG